MLNTREQLQEELSIQLEYRTKWWLAQQSPGTSELLDSARRPRRFIMYNATLARQFQQVSV